MTGSASLDAVFAELLKAGESIPRIREVLVRCDPDDALLRTLLRRAVPVRLLEYLAVTKPWSEDVRLQAAIVLNPRTPRGISLRLISNLHWRDLADVAASARLEAGVRVRAEQALRERLPLLRFGDRITLGRIATPPLIAALLSDAERKVLEACLLNPRLREQDLVAAVRRDDASAPLLQCAGTSERWRNAYALRLALALQPRTPVALALAILPGLLPQDRKRISQTPALAPLVRALAARVAAGTSVESGG